MSVRVRFAPSPTGHLHIGGLRSALFNWLFARHHGGVFLLRIEDTDHERSKPEFTRSILDSFAWAELAYDEPVVIQSERITQHQCIAHELVAAGKAYYCYCPPNPDQGSGYTTYDGRCRELREKLDKPAAIRFKTPRSGSIDFTDLIHGPMSFSLDTIDDFIIVRSDGTPMYNFVVVVDDAFMRITHVIRGEEHLVNTPRQILIYQACGYPLPHFAHLPLILGSSGSKLSKRDAAVSVLEYKDAGFLPDGLCNYLARLGWSHGDQEIFSRAELITYFDLAHVGKTGAIFDTTKLLWVNSMHLKQLSAAQLSTQLDGWQSGWKEALVPLRDDQIRALLDLYKERSQTLKELFEQVRSVALVDGALLKNDPLIAAMRDVQWQALDLLIQSLSHSQYSREEVVTAFKQVCDRMQLGMADIAKPVRLALTGSLAAPGVYELVMALQDTAVARLRMLGELR